MIMMKIQVKHYKENFQWMVDFRIKIWRNNGLTEEQIDQELTKRGLVRFYVLPTHPPRKRRHSK